MTRAFNVVVGVLLFGCGFYKGLVFYVKSYGLSFLGWYPSWWQAWTPITLSWVAALAAIGLCFRRRFFGIVASVLMLALAVLSIWPLISWHEFYVDEFLQMTVPLLLTSALVYWRFVMTPRV